MPGVGFHLTRRQEMKTVDRAMSAVAFIQPLTALPQLWTIYVHHNVQGVSVATWLLFALFGIVFTAYSIMHRIKPLIILQVFWFIMDAAVVAGVLIYR